MLNNILKIGGVIVLAVILFVGGVWLGTVTAGRFSPRIVAQPNIIAIPPRAPRNDDQGGNRGGNNDNRQYGPGMMGPGFGGGNYDNRQYGPGMMGPGFGGGSGAQLGPQGGMMGQNGAFAQGMMGGFAPDPSLVPADGQTLTIDNAVKVAEAYLAAYGDDNLKLAEVMEFDNHFYAAIVEKDSGRGALEVLIDPQTAAVHPEPGPNMMWNVKYGMMGAQGGMMGGQGMMGGVYSNDGGATMTIDLAEAKAFAQKELDSLKPGAKIEGDGTAFYGYFTFDYEVDGKIAGMLGVNGYTGQVWLHTWHGSFVGEQEVK